jgi:3-oxoacyl-[acyl-carrier-protein] synthase-3
MNIALKSCSFYVPENMVDNQFIIDLNSLKMKASWVEKRIGITHRHWASEDQAASDLATEAAKKLNLKDFNGSLWVSTISQDFYTPSTASLVKKRLGIEGNAPAIDLNGACAGQIFALDCAYRRLLASDETEALVIATELRSKFLNKHDRRTVFLFGDGASAIHLKKEEGDYFLHWVESLTIPSDQYDIFIPAGGSREPLTAQSIEEHKNKITMNDGVGIFEKTTESLVEVINKLIHEKNESLSDYAYFMFHQGNGAIIRKILENLNLSEEQTHINFNKFGNTSSASMGIALAEAIELGKIKKGDKVMCLAMGAGYHIGVMSFTWGGH